MGMIIPPPRARPEIQDPACAESRASRSGYCGGNADTGMGCTTRCNRVSLGAMFFLCSFRRRPNSQPRKNAREIAGFFERGRWKFECWAMDVHQDVLTGFGE